MNVEKAQEIRAELDYGLKYIAKSIKPMAEVNLAITKIAGARMALGRACNYTGGVNPYPEMSNPENEVIENEVDRVNPEDVEVDTSRSQVQHIKFVIRGLILGLEKVSLMRMSRMNASNAESQYLATRSLDRSIDSLEEAICFLRRALVYLAKQEPGKYPTEAPKADPEKEEIKEEAKTTDKIMESRAKEDIEVMNIERSRSSILEQAKPVEEDKEELDPNRPYTGEDYLPGGRLHKDSEEEKVNVGSEDSSDVARDKYGNVIGDPLPEEEPAPEEGLEAPESSTPEDPEPEKDVEKKTVEDPATSSPESSEEETTEEE